MTKTVKKVRDFFQKKEKSLGEAMKAADAKRAERSFHYWAEWHAMDYIRWEIAKEFWGVLLGSLEKLGKAGAKDYQIVQWLVDLREQMVNDSLRATAHHSTNQLGNMIEAEKQEVYRKLAGSNSLDTGSLSYLLADLKRM
jgi:hypothetical protein